MKRQTNAEIIQAEFKEGITHISLIASRNNIPRETIRTTINKHPKLLKQYNAFKAQRNSEFEAKKTQAAKLWEQGKSIREVMALTGLSQSSVYSALDIRKKKEGRTEIQTKGYYVNYFPY